ncbi:MAG: putative glycolipid-binding domain-containing protein [Actinomycetota bacterium]
MPFGRYAVLGDDGERVGTEEFRCAPGPMGWRYFSEVETTDPTPHHETVDVAVDETWRVANVHVATGEHELLLRPDAAGTTLAGVLDGRPIELEYGPELHLDYFTPATNAITAHRLTGTTEIDVLYLAPVTIEPSRVHQRYELIGNERVETPVGAFDARRWRYTSLDSGWTADLWVAGDIVVRYERLFELTWLDPGASGPHPVA